MTDDIRFEAPVPDYCFDRKASQGLVREINRYWFKRGIQAEAYITEEKFGPKTLYNVRSKLSVSMV